MTASVRLLAGTAVLVGAHALLAQLCVRVAVRRAMRAASGVPPDRRAVMRALYPEAVAGAVCWVLCVALFARSGEGELPGAGPVLVLSVATAALLVSIFLPFAQLEVRRSGERLRGKRAIAVLARTAALQVIGYGIGISVFTAAVVLAARLEAAPAWLRAAMGGAGMIAGLAIVYGVYPLLVRVLYRARPLDDAGLADALARLGEASGVRLGRLYRVPAPWGAANAMVSGILPGVRWVFVTDALLNQAPADEVAAIVAHELAHLEHRHLSRNFWRTAAGVVISGVGLFGVRTLLTSLGLGGGPVTLVIAVMAAWVVLALVWSLPSTRRHEVEADRTAARWVGAELYARALTRLHDLNGVASDPGRVERLMSTHPGLSERLRKL
ncbi:MAG TPA: M48 family metalloprotease [Longimicrobiales bacterium]